MLTRYYVCKGDYSPLQPDYRDHQLWAEGISKIITFPANISKQIVWEIQKKHKKMETLQVQLVNKYLKVKQAQKLYVIHNGEMPPPLDNWPL